MNALLRSVIAVALLALSSSSFAQEPLDLSNPTARTVWVHFEESSDPTAIGQTFGPPFPATYWVEGNTGKLLVDAIWHRQLRMQGFSPEYSAMASALEYEIDLTTLEASSQPAFAEFRIMRGAGIFYTTWIDQQALGTTASAGVISGNHTTKFCADQAYVDQLCGQDSDYCGETCTPILGLPYDPDTGLVNLVGREDNQTCDRCCCGPPLNYASLFGDLLLTEVAEAPGLPNRPLAVVPVTLIMALVAGTVLFRMRTVAKYLPCAIAIAFGTCASSFAQEALDISNPKARTVMVQVENSADPTVVGQSFSAPVPATYYAQGNTGHLLLSATSCGQLRLEGLGSGVSASFPSLHFEIDLATLEVTA